MSVKNFKFVSPGVFINEIDNSFIPKSPQAIGPVVIGRATRGLAMQPVQVSSYADFVEMFGDTVPGRAGGDIYRNGNYQSPMYGTYAAKAFLNADVAPLTYIRLLGEQTTAGGTAGADAGAGWKTTNLMGNPSPTALGTATGGDITYGGAYGLWIFPSGTNDDLAVAPQFVTPGAPASSGDFGEASAGILAAIWYMNSGSFELSGNLRGGMPPGGRNSRGTCQCIGSDANGVFTTIYTDSNAVEHTIKFDFDDESETFIRKRFNTNPQLLNASGTFYPVQDHIFLGESFEQNVRAYQSSGSTLVGKAVQGVIYGVQRSGSTLSPAGVKQASREAVAGWFIGQDLGGNPATYKPAQQQKLFRLKGRGHGEWLNKHAKVSIEKVRISTSTTTQYGTFSVVIRSLLDTDNNVVILERFDNCSLDPTSPNYVARVIGDTYLSWSTNERRLRQYGEYENNSKFVYVEMNEDVDAGASDPLLLPFGYFGPPGFKPLLSGSGPMDGGNAANRYVTFTGSIPKAFHQGYNGGDAGPREGYNSHFLSGGHGGAVTSGVKLTASLYFPVDQLRISASAGGLSNPTNAYFGYQVTRTSGSTRPDPSCADIHRLLIGDFVDDPTSGQAPALNPGGTMAGINAWSYVFSLDDVRMDGSGRYFYQSGSRASSLSITTSSYENLLNQAYNRFTAPFWGGFDGFNIQKPDPLYNAGMGASVTEDTSYAFHTYAQAIDTVADPEFIDMNLLAAPGLTHTSLTGRMIDVCEDRADTLAVIDLPDVYIPSAEAYYNSKNQRIGTTPVQAATNLRNRRIDSSYGCTFYPWVQTRDAASGRLLWIPPSVAMLGVLASSQKASELWFAPAGFNRGGLSDGAAGIPITAVTERLTSKNRDTLYESRINPIASFPSSGIVVFGQKTLQERQSALDRINVRRLVIYLKKQISILATQILFEQNVQATWNRFKSLIEPLLANTKVNFGITDYRLILDESTTTPDLIDQNILYAKIMVKPARAIEYIAIDFVIASTGASFDD
jgi:hypothetical protein